MQDNPFLIDDEDEDDVEYNGLDTHCVYFFQLPLGNVIKIGETTIRDLNGRVTEAQRYFVDDVSLLGIEYCVSKSDAREKEQKLLRFFSRLRPKGELVQDSMAVRHYIDCNCIDGWKALEKSRRAKREYDRKRKWDSRH